MCSFWIYKKKIKRRMVDSKKTLQDLNKVDILEPNNAFILSTRGDVKKRLYDYQRVLQNLDKSHDLEPNNAFTSRTRGDVKKRFYDCQGVWQDLKKAHDLKPNNAFILKTHGDVKRSCMIVKELCKTLIKSWSRTKQCIHFENVWGCQKDVGRFSRSFARLWQGWCSQTKQCI